MHGHKHAYTDIHASRTAYWAKSKYGDHVKMAAGLLLRISPTMRSRTSRSTALFRKLSCSPTRLYHHAEARVVATNVL